MRPCVTQSINQSSTQSSLVLLAQLSAQSNLQKSPHQSVNQALNQAMQSHPINQSINHSFKALLNQSINQLIECSMKAVYLRSDWDLIKPCGANQSIKHSSNPGKQWFSLRCLSLFLVTCTVEIFEWAGPSRAILAAAAAAVVEAVATVAVVMATVTAVAGVEVTAAGGRGGGGGGGGGDRSCYNCGKPGEEERHAVLAAMIFCPVLCILTLAFATLTCLSSSNRAHFAWLSLGRQWRGRRWPQQWRRVWRP